MTFVRALLTFVLASGMGGPTAHAQHPALEEGQRLFEEGELLAALDAYTRAESGTDLGVTGLETLFERRALAYRVLGDDAAMEAELRRLASLSPDHRFANDVPPDVQELFVRLRARLRGRIAIRARAEDTATGVTIRATVTDDPASIVRQVALSGRRVGAPWNRSRTDALSVDADVGDIVEFYALAIGPGGAEVARAGSAEEPLTRQREASDGDGGGSIWPWVAVGTGLVAVAATVAIIVLVGASGPTQTQPSAPMEVTP